MEYISLNRYDIPEVEVFIMISFIESCWKKESCPLLIHDLLPAM